MLFLLELVLNRRYNLRVFLGECLLLLLIELKRLFVIRHQLLFVLGRVCYRVWHQEGLRHGAQAKFDGVAA